MPVRSPSPDPFSSFTSPPPNESPSDRAARLSRETEARRVSNSIDEGIREERAVIRRREKEVIKVLLLGQAESGKSTTLKNFRMKYAKEAWRAERTSWRAAILLNVVKAVLNILHALSTRPAHSSLETPTADLSPGTEQPPLSSVPSSPVDPPSDNLSPGSPTATAMSMSIMQHPPSLASLRPSLSHPTSQGTLPAEHAQFVERLLEPLLRLERELKVHLGPASEEIGEFGMPEAAEHAHPDGSPKQQISPTSPSDSHHAHHDDDEHDQTHDHLQSPTPFDIPRPPPAQPPENEHVSPRALGIDTNVGVHAGTGTVSAGAITPATATAPSPATGPSSAITPATATNGTTTMNTAARDLVQKRRYANGFLVRCWPGGPCRAREREGDPPSPIDLTRISSVLAPLVPDMNALWADPVAKELVRRRRVRVEDGVEFLLTDLARVTAPAYVPTDDDIICCRLRTTGVTEYALTFPTGMEEEEGGLRSKLPRISFGKEWIMYDVGGARTNRYAWQSYFENVNAIIFLAPISCFDERLLEDTRINRLEDSFLLWKSIVSSRFFTKTTMVVFLNKVDILRRKLEEGRMVNRFLPSYGARENEWKVVVKYLRDKFKEMSRQFSPQPRVVYLYSTSVINTKATSQTLKSVRDGILREHLVSAELA